MSDEAFKKRTFQFGIDSLQLAKELPRSMVEQIVGKQFIRSATSVGANYRAAVRARSRSEFISRMGVVEEECDESIYWMEVMMHAGLLKHELAPRVDQLTKEAHQILAITIASIKTARRNA